VKRTIRKHLGDFLAVLGLIVVAAGISSYILSQQRLRFPFIEEKPVEMKVELPDAQAVIPGQGQTVRAAGVRIGDIGQVELVSGRAVVSLMIDPKYVSMIRTDATALLRTKTGLKDMFIELDPGEGKPLGEGGTIHVDNTAPDIDPDEFLSALDADTRDYLRLLITGAGNGLKGRSTDLAETFKRLGPIHRDLTKVTKAIARRRSNMRRLIHNYGLLTTELGRSDRDITRLVRASNAVFEATGSEESNISSFVSKLPGSLRETQGALVKVDRLGQRLTPALNALRPPIRKLDEANEAVLPLVREATPIIKNEIRPFTRSAQPFTRDLRIGARDLAKGVPDLTTSFKKLNRFFNIGAYNPGGAESVSEGCERDGNCTVAERARNEGYLYWLGWIANNTTSLFSTADAQGVFRRITLGGVSCDVVAQIVAGSAPANAPTSLPPELAGLSAGLLDQLGLPADTITNPSQFVDQILGPLGVCSA